MADQTAYQTPEVASGGTGIDLLGSLAGVESLLRKAARSLFVHCAVEGDDGPRLSGESLDAHQIPLYGMAFAAAEVLAARSLAAYAGRARVDESDPAFLDDLARSFWGEVVVNTERLLLDHQEELGLTQQDLLEVFPPDLLTACRAARSSAALISLGERLAARDGDLGPDLLAEHHRMMRTTFTQFGRAEVTPIAETIHREDLTVPDRLVDGLAALGCFGLSVPESFGGLKPDTRDDSIGMIVATEELSRYSLGAAGSLITRPEILARALLEGGTEAQKQKWLTGIASGQILCAISVTEPGTGSDVAAASLRATPTVGGWLLNGAKTWCTFAGKADVMMVIARTDPDAKPAHRGLSLFLVEKPRTDDHVFSHEDGRGGTVSGTAIPTIGYRGMHSYAVFYDDFFVPDSHLIGEAKGQGRGFYYTMRGFSGGRIQTAARATGIMQAAFDAARFYAAEREVFGRRVADYALTQGKLVRMAALIQACRQLSYEVADQMDEGEGQMEASLVKLLACKSAEWVTREAMQIHGGMGYAEETAVSRYFVDARVLSIFEGAEETLALRVVGRELVQRAGQGGNR